jgi:RNA polymerase sigma factor (TIGR02999 family)
MREDDPGDVTQILLDLGSGASVTPEVTDRIFQVAYEELRRVAGGLMRRERADHTLQPTALVNEAYLRLADESRLEWQNRAHFFGIAARAMRQLLIEHARRRGAEKRGGGLERVTLDERLGVAAVNEFEILELDDALTKLGRMDERMARIVELRFFGGLTAEETAHVLDVSRRTVTEDWRVARMWLAHELAGEGS